MIRSSASRAAILGVLAAVACACLLLALSAGELAIGAGQVWAALLGSEDLAASIVRELRLPRALATLACGGLLATAGALMQVLLRNPLADPYILGVSGGAAVGALGAMLLVFGLARGDGSWTQTRLLLTGVIVAAGCGAAVTLMLALAPETRVHSMLFWLMGDASAVGRPWWALLVLVCGVLAVLPFARDLNVLAQGELQARALGVEVQRLRFGLYVLASLLTATAVSLVGSVGFVGLVVPHLMRMLLGNDQRLLVPAAALAGGSLLTLADTAARTVIAPQQLPVGVLTALIGVPLFLFLLSRHRR